MSILDEIEAAIPALRRYAVALLRDPVAADDLVQDCLERALARRHGWRGEGSVRAWMFSILLNRHRDLLRRRPEAGHLVAVEDLPVEPASLPVQDDRLALAEVQAAMGRLPAEQRQALLLVALEGMSLAEAATALDVPAGTVMSRIGRARAALRAMTGRGLSAGPPAAASALSRMPVAAPAVAVPAPQAETGAEAAVLVAPGPDGPGGPPTSGGRRQR